MVKIETSFRERLEIALNAAGMKPIDLSRKTGLSQSTISQYRSGYSTPKSKRLKIIADALHVDPGWLYGLNTDMLPKIKAENEGAVVSLDTDTSNNHFLNLIRNDSDFMDYIKRLYYLDEYTKKEIYDYIDFKAAATRRGDSSGSQQTG